MLPSASAALFIGALAVVATGAATVLVGRQLSAPNAKFLFSICLLLVVTVISHLLITVPSPVRTAIIESTGLQLPGDYWVAVALGLGLPLDGLWLLFAVGYTGRGNQLRRQVAAIVVALVTFWYVAAAYAVVQSNPTQPPDFTISSTLFTGLFFLSQLASLGSLLVLETALRRNTISLTEGLPLAFGSFFFIYAPAIGANLDRPTVIPTLALAAAVLVIFAVRQNSLFDTLPAARIAARDRLVDSINEAVLLVDMQGHVVELNPQAEQLFDAVRSDVDRQQLSAVVPDAPAPADLAATGDPFRLYADRKRLEITATEVAGEYSDSVGYLLVCRDVTEQRRRERRLRVLTQFLAGTVGERTAVVAKQADQLTVDSHQAGDDTTTALAREIRQTTESIQEFVTTARRIERSLSDHSVEPTDIAAVTRDIATDRADTSLTAEHDEKAVVAVDPAVLRAVLDLLVAERLEQGCDHVELTVQSSKAQETSILLHFSCGVEHNARQDNGTVGEQDSTVAPIHALCQLALEHANGELSRPHDDCLRIGFRTDSSTASTTAFAEDTPDETSSPDHHVRIEHNGEQS